MSYEQIKLCIKKYHNSEKGKIARRLANKRYFQKLMSSNKGKVRKKMYNQRCKKQPQNSIHLDTNRVINKE